MRVLVTGANGQLGLALQARVPGGVECLPATRELIDITDSSAVAAKRAQMFVPALWARSQNGSGRRVVRE